MYRLTDKEGTVINSIREDFFADYDCRKLIGNIDFSVAVRKDTKDLFPETEYLLWAEAKAGNRHNIYDSFIQLILTIGRERAIDRHLPPKFLGAFDAEKIAFIPYSAVMEVFTQNDFNWNAAPSDHESKEFRQLKELVRRELDINRERDAHAPDTVFVFYFDRDEKELRNFIRKNFVSGRDSIQRIRVNHNNFKAIYERWRQEVKPTIAVDWDNVKRSGLLDADFYLADLMAENNLTLLENLNVLLRATHYELDRKLDTDGLWSSKQVQFRDGMQAHTLFWCKYARPPKREYWDRIVERRDLLVPQDIRERKGSYFTPAVWVQKSQEYIEAVLGENWQDEYYVWDCCAGTGNLLAGLTNKYNIWASTLDKSDVDVMLQRIDEMGGGTNLLKSHVFRFDFLNDDFSRLPQGLQDIINDPDKRRRLVVYINPPYAEAANARTSSGTGNNRIGVSNTMIRSKYDKEMGKAANELFAQFFARIAKEIPTSVLAVFSTLKILQAPNFTVFRKNFRALPGRIFLVPANTFDNVTGQFPIGFQIWRTATEDFFNEAEADVYDSKGVFVCKKHIYANNDNKFIVDWLRSFYDKAGEHYAYLRFLGADFQNNKGVFLTLTPSKNDLEQVKGTWVTPKNILPCCIYFAVRHCIEANWLNDRDQFLYPDDGWQEDRDFRSDCLAFTLFHGQNRISMVVKDPHPSQGSDGKPGSDSDVKHGSASLPVNHWIPFTEQEVDAPDNFRSHFMSDFIKGRIKPAAPSEKNLFSGVEGNAAGNPAPEPLRFTPAAQAVMEAGRRIWHYYLHHRPAVYGAAPVDVNASFHDIRAYFQGRDDKGRMNPDSPDGEYMRLLKDLRQKQKTLAAQIAEKVYQYGFLK